MSYTIRQKPAAQYETVNGLNGLELRSVPNEFIPPQSYVRKLYESGSFELWEDVNGAATVAELDEKLPDFRPYRERQIRARGAERLGKIASPYSPEERETWPYQREECQTFYRDPSALTPFCDSIAEQRGIPRDIFLAKVKENMDLFSAASAYILGQQQALIDAVYRAQTIDDILSIDWA